MNDNTDEGKKPRRKKKRALLGDMHRFEREYGTPDTPAGPFAESYKIAAYADGIVGASPECDVLKPHWDSGLKWLDKNNPQPEDWRWGPGVRGGVTWDGKFYRDTVRFPAGGPLFWASYLSPGSEAGIQKGFWMNFGSGWSHLFNDDPAQILGGAAQKIFYDTAAGHWKLVIQATKFVTFEVIDVWTGTKQGGNDPVGTYARSSGLDPVASLTIEAA